MNGNRKCENGKLREQFKDNKIGLKVKTITAQLVAGL